MGGHGLYVWSSYALFILLLGINILQPLLTGKRIAKGIVRQLRRGQLSQ